MIKKITTLITFILILLSTSCGKQNKALTLADLGDFLPANPQLMITISSYEKFIKDLFSISAYFFEKDTIREFKNKLFRPLKNQLGLNLLNKKNLEEAGFNSDKNILIAIYPHNRFYLSLPINSTEKAISFIKSADSDTIKFQNSGKIKTAKNSQFRFILSTKRLFIIDKKIKQEKRQLTYLTKIVKRLSRESRYQLFALRTGKITLIPFLPSYSYLSLSSHKHQLRIKVNWHKNRNPLYSMINNSLGIKISPYLGMSNKGNNILKMTTAKTPFFLNLNIKQKKIWQKEIKPRIIKEAEKRIGAVGNLVMNLFNTKKPMVEKVIDGLEIDLQILNRMTGNIGFVINDISQLRFISPSMRNMLNNISGFLYFEFKNEALAKAAWLHTRSLLNSYKIRVTKDDFKGEPHYSISLYRFRIPTYLFFKRVGSFLFISHNHDSITQIRKDFFQKQSGSNLASFKKKKTSYLMGINIVTIYKMLIERFDSITQGNLAPISQQIKKVKSIITYNKSHKSEETVQFQINLKKKLLIVNPFEDKIELFDILFLLLTIFFSGMILFFIIRTLLIKIKLRNL